MGAIWGDAPSPAPGTWPSAASQSQSGLGNQFWPVPSQREEAGDGGALPLCLQSPSWPLGGPGLGPNVSRFPRRRLAAPSTARRGHPLMVRSEGLGLPPGMLPDGRLGSGLCLIGPQGSYPSPHKLLSQHSGIRSPSQSPSCLCPLHVPTLFLLQSPPYPPLVTPSSTGSPVSFCPLSPHRRPWP